MRHKQKRMSKAASKKSHLEHCFQLFFLLKEPTDYLFQDLTDWQLRNGVRVVLIGFSKIPIG